MEARSTQHTSITEHGGSPKKLFSILFFNVEPFLQSASKRLVFAPIQKSAPRADAQAVDLRRQHAGFEILDSFVNDPVILAKFVSSRYGNRARS